MTPFVDVLVVGGGPAGLAAAHAVTVARPALKVAVCERSDLRPRGAIVFLPPNGVRAIEAIRPSLKPALARHHTTHMKVRSFTPTGELKMSADDGGIMAKMAALDGGERITIPWHTLQRELADGLPPGMVHTHHRFLGYTETADGVLAEFATADGEVKRVEAKVLVGCDGGQSMVREQLLGDGPPKYLGMAIWRAVRPRPADWPVDEGYVGFGNPGQASALTHTIGGAGDMMAFQAFAPWPEDQLHVIGGGRQAYIQDAAVGPAAGSKGEERLQRALAAFDSYPKALKDLIATTSPSAVAEHGQFSRDVEQCQVYSKGRVALTGDAAHLATPFLGQGCSQALEDALELGRAIGVHGATPEALAAYASVRVPLASAVQAASVQLFKDFMQGKQGKSEFEINSEMGFTKRTFEPLAPAQAAPAKAAPASAPA